MTLSTSDIDHNDLEALSVLANYRRWIVDEFKAYLGASTVEFGAGIGSISAELARHADELHLVEPLEPLFRKLEENFAGRRGVRLSCATIEASVSATAAAAYDSAVLVNVLEHISDDRGTVDQLYRILKPGGSLCLFVPAHAFLFSDYDRLVGHHRRYELPSLRALLMSSGFEIIRAVHFDVIGVLPWLISMRLLGQTRIRPGLARLYDAVAVPIGRAVELVIPPPFGKNIVVVARKPADA